MGRRNVNVEKVEKFSPYLNWEDDAEAEIPMPRIKKDGEVINKYTDVLLNTRYDVVRPDNAIMIEIDKLSKGKVTLTSQRWRTLIKFVCDKIIVGIEDGDLDLITQLQEEGEDIEPLGDWAEEKAEHEKLLIEEEELTNRFLRNITSSTGLQKKKPRQKQKIHKPL